VKKTVPNIIKQEKVSKPVNVISDDQVVMAKCPKCDKKFTSVTTILKHLYIHFNYKPFYCKYCDSKFSREDHCKLHVKAVHSDKPEQYDMKTDEAIEQKIKKLYESAKRSTIKQKMMLGKFRPAKLNKMELIEEGIRRKDKLFYCDFCQYSSDRKATIRKHVSAVHAGISKKRPLVIDSDTELPAKKFAKKTDGDTNDTSIDEEEDDETEKEEELQPLKYKVVKTPTGSKKFKCTGCDYMNPKKKNLKLHVARHHSVKSEPAFKCLSCSYTSANR
jgi:KRAB domain-containing zinc finger protein